MSKGAGANKIIAFAKAVQTVADPTEIAAAVDDYLEDHPEATCPIDDTAGDGDTGKVWSADKSAGEVSTLTEAIAPLTPAATSGDVGKFLKAKTVSGGKVTEYEFGEASGGALSNDIKEALLACFENVAWVGNDGYDYYSALYEALYGVPPTPTNPYTFYDYIQSDGTAFIDTGLDAQTYSADEYEKTLKFVWTSFASTDYPYLVGAANSSGSDAFYVCGEKSSSSTSTYLYICKQYQTVTIQRNALTEVKFADKKIYLDGTQIYTGTQASRTITYDMNIPLFAIANGSSQYQGGISYDGYNLSKPCPAKIYEFTVNDGQGNPVAHMIPAKRNSDNVVGMWDTVREQFFVNANASGTFTVGNDE